MKHIFITGGVVSGLGKGITAAALGRLLKSRGYKVISQKLDPYLNIDPGTMSPTQHGEVFVTEDGSECDLDLGHYERFIDENLNKYSNLTSGKTYFNVLAKERNGEYLGETVQVIPHITNEIKSFIYNVGKHSNADIVITEIGGTVGDIESTPFLEACRQLKLEVGRNDCFNIHVTLVPYLSGSKELKTKPTQHSVKELQALGIHPDMIVVRCDQHVDEAMKSKLSTFCNVRKEHVIHNSTLDILYDVVNMLEEQNMSSLVLDALDLSPNTLDLSEWNKMIDQIKACDNTVNVALVGKYITLHDAYLSVVESLNHAGYPYHTKININWIDAEDINQDNVNLILKDNDAIIVPGGFGERGIEGMIEACRFARENNIPYLGICLGMQIACIEFARNVIGLKDATSQEFNINADHKIIHIMEDQKYIEKMGGTLRKGAYDCRLKTNTLTKELYGNDIISERHRHRYEFNNIYRKDFEASGLSIVGTSLDDTLVEVVENINNDFFIAAQYHPEFKSRPNNPHPLFKGFIKAAIKNKK